VVKLELHNTAITATERRIFIGDAFKLIGALADKSLDLIITSPPYWGQRSYGLPHNWDILKDRIKEVGKTAAEEPPGWEWYSSHGGVLGLEPYPSWFVTHLVEFFERARAKLRDDGSFWINLGDTYFARWASIRDQGRQGLGNNPRFRRKTPMGGYLQEKNLLLIPARFSMAMQDKKWILRNDLIWFKPNIPPRPETDRLRLSHEHFLHFVKKPTTGRAKYFYDSTVTEKGQYDVVTCNVRSGENEHTATFPKELIRPRIESSSRNGGWVLDPFCGTGRVLDVSNQLGRNAIGFELVSEFLSNGQEQEKHRTK
jgi:DNA modification methylase